MTERELKVAYLVWAPLGLDAVARFAASYRAQPAGAPHRLVLLFNGFDGHADARLAAVEQECNGIEHDSIIFDTPLLDLAAYRLAAEQLAPARCCFLNSYSRILAPNWLAHLSTALDSPEVGLVGASGSWGSMRSYVRFQFGLGGAYGAVFSDRRATNQTLAAIDARNAPAAPRPGFLAKKLKTARATFAQTHRFQPFPARHIRSTGFMIDSGTLADLQLGRLDSKIETYRIESGVDSLTAQVERSGLRTEVVDRHGETYRPEGWPASHTFWQAGQENLLIADKQTEHYDEVGAAGRAVLAGFAWGEQADPCGADTPHGAP
jgi:hypothetical protein